MVKRVLAGAGFVEDKTFKETRFLKPPKTTYAVFMDSFTRRGADGLNLILIRSNCTPISRIPTPRLVSRPSSTSTLSSTRKRIVIGSKRSNFFRPYTHLITLKSKEDKLCLLKRETPRLLPSVPVIY